MDATAGTARTALAGTYLVSVCALTSFYLTLGAVPLYAIHGGHGEATAAVSTTVFMVATVLAELGTTRLLARFGYRPTMVAGLVLLSAPVLALTATADATVILTVSALRGAGFALVVITTAALVARLTDPVRHGAELGRYGVVVGLPSIVALPLGVWLTAAVGFAAVFVAAGLVAAIGLAAAARGAEPASPAETPAATTGLSLALRRPGVAVLAAVFATGAVASGVLVTFLPLSVAAGHGAAAAGAVLLLLGIATTWARRVAGRISDRVGPAALLAPALAAATAGVLLVAGSSALAVIALGAVAFGAGFGALQNATLHAMLSRVPESGYGAVSAAWNIAFDAGLGGGALGFALVASADPAVALVMSAALMLAALASIAVWRVAASRVGVRAGRAPTARRRVGRGRTSARSGNA